MKLHLQVAPKGKVYAIDEDEAAIKLTVSNVEKFGVKNYVSVSSGKAPEALLSLPNADAYHHWWWRSLLRAILQFANVN